MMFSATFPNDIQRLAGDFLTNYLFLAVGRVGGAASDIEQRVLYVQDEEKDKYLMDELEKWKNGRVLIFVETKRKADELESFLDRRHFKVAMIHGDRSQDNREKALNDFKSNKVQVLVATDVAARGLDIPDVSVVINYDATHNIDEYVHRIGRTGRAGNEGVAVTFLNEKNRFVAKDIFFILKETKQTIPDFLENLCFSQQKSGEEEYRRNNRDRSFGGRDIRRSAPRSTQYYRRDGDRVDDRRGGRDDYRRNDRDDYRRDDRRNDRDDFRNDRRNDRDDRRDNSYSRDRR